MDLASIAGILTDTQHGDKTGIPDAHHSSNQPLTQHSDVEIVTPADTEVLTYEAATALWKNKPAPAAAPHADTHHAGGTDPLDLALIAGILTDAQHGDKTTIPDAHHSSNQPLTEHSDVEIVTPADEEVLTYEAATALWKNKPVPAVGLQPGDVVILIFETFGALGSPGSTYTTSDVWAEAKFKQMRVNFDALDIPGANRIYARYLPVIKTNYAGSTAYTRWRNYTVGVDIAVLSTTSTTYQYLDSGWVDVTGWTGVNTLRPDIRSGISGYYTYLAHPTAFIIAAARV